MRIVWSLVRIFYLVDVVFLAAFVALWKGGPPPNGDFVHQFIGVIALNVCCVVIGWAFLPWPKDRKKELPATPAAPPAPPFDYGSELQTIDGQDTLQDFLDRRWRDRLAGIRPPQRKRRKSMSAPMDPRFPNESWKAVMTGGDFAARNLAFCPIPDAQVVFSLKEDQDIDFYLDACARTCGTCVGLRIDDVQFEGPGVSAPVLGPAGPDLAVPLRMHLRRRIPAGVHRAQVVVRQAVDAAQVAVLSATPEMPLKLEAGY